MSTHFEILIDASGSMGYMQGTEHENKYLLPDNSTRTDLVKKILSNTIIPKLSFVDSLSISTFRDEYILNKNGERIIVNNKYNCYPDLKDVFTGDFDLYEITAKVNNLLNPDPNGTPLSWATCLTINQSIHDNINIIIFSDGDDSGDNQFDGTILKTIGDKNCKIYFIGIDQNPEASKKSKNLADQTGGFYVNLRVINYDESVFDSLLFNFNTTITSNAIKDSLKITSPIAVTTSNGKDDKSEVPLNKKPNSTDEATAEEDKIKVPNATECNTEKNDLKSQVNENTKSLKLISSQLDSIVRQLSNIGKEKANDDDEFIANEDEAFNRAVGYKCEMHLNSVFKKKNWEKVNWLNEVNEQNKPYDFEVIVNGINFFIECKGSASNSKEFLLTKNEWQFYLQNRKNYRLYFVSGINTMNPTIIRIEDLLTEMEESKLIPCSKVNRVNADRINFQIID